MSTVLYVTGEGVDIEITGTDNFDRMSIIHFTVAMQVPIGSRWCFVFLHTVRPDQMCEVREWHPKI